MGYWGVVMQDPACELPRRPIPRTPVNKTSVEGIDLNCRGSQPGWLSGRKRPLCALHRKDRAILRVIAKMHDCKKLL
jgi:hypothetical protein